MQDIGYDGPERRRPRKGNNGAVAFGRRRIDRISRPRTVVPPVVVLVIILLLLYAAVVLT